MSDARLPKNLRRRAGSPRCADCGHPEVDHVYFRRRITCGVVCGCAEFVPVTTPTPIEHRDGRDAFADRFEHERHTDMGAHQPSEWPDGAA